MIKKSISGMLLLCALSAGSYAQVGINTTEPKAQLDIISQNPSTPAITDGILIPRISNFPTAKPSADQHGMLVFLDTQKEDPPAGFYYWDQTTGQWEGLSGKAFSNFYKNGSNTPSGNIKDAVYRNGNVSIGTQVDHVKLKVRISPEEDHLTKTGLDVENASSSLRNVTYGILSSNKSITADKKYGIKNSVSADGEGIHYGIYNETFQKTNEEIYGIYNSVGKTFGATKNHFGIYSEIGTVQGTGMVYGIYSKAAGNDPRKVFAGYFAGRVGIGATAPEEYILPDKRGTKDQILVMNDGGLVTWKHPNTFNYSSTTSSTGNYIIPEEVYTLRINNQVSTLTIPEASSNKGRILILIGWPGISTKALSFLGNDDLLDITSNTQVTGIRGGERLMIQSAGNRWLVIGR